MLGYEPCMGERQALITSVSPLPGMVSQCTVGQEMLIERKSDYMMAQISRDTHAGSQAL